MKNLKKSLIIAAYCLIVGTAFTSCLDSDSDSNYFTPRVMTDAERGMYLSSVSGTYTGSLKYSYEDAITGKRGNASVDVDMTVGYDKTITIEELPDSVFRHFISGNSPVRTIADNAKTKHDLTMNIGSFFVEEDKAGNIGSKYFFFDAKKTPYSFNYTAVEDGVEITYPVTVRFADTYTDPMNYTYVYSSFGSYDREKKEMLIQLILEGVKTEGSENRQTAFFVFTGKK